VVLGDFDYENKPQQWGDKPVRDPYLHLAIVVLYNNCLMKPNARSASKLSVREFRRDLRVFERDVVRQLEGQTICCGVSLPQCHVLLELSQQSLSLTALADALDLDKSTLSRTIEAMVQSDLVERTTAATNRRSVSLKLTNRGRERADSIDQLCTRYYGALLGELSESDRRDAVRIVRLLAQAMKRLRSSASG